MSAVFINCEPTPLFGEDYRNLRDFLVRLDSHNYHFGRWDWMITHGYLNKSGLSQIGLWEENGVVVATATYDCSLGKAYLLKDKAHQHLSEEMLLYAKDAFANEMEFRVLILDGDRAMQDIAVRNGFFPTQDKECDAIYPMTSAKYNILCQMASPLQA